MRTELKEKSMIGVIITTQERGMETGPGVVKADGLELRVLPEHHYI